MKTLTALLFVCISAAVNAAENPAKDPYSKAAAQIISACLENNIRSIALLPFENKNSAPQEQVDYSFEKLLSALQAQDRVFVFENSLGPIESQKNKIEGYVLVKAFGSEEKIRTIVKVIRASDGLVVKSGEGELPSRTFTKKDKFSLADVHTDIPDYRDAVKDFKERDCGEMYAKIYPRQEELLEAKAKFWAGKLSDPSFSLSSLRRNPGSEIKSPFLKQQFYSLLGEFKKRGEISLSEKEKEQLKELFKSEKTYIDECGI